MEEKVSENRNLQVASDLVTPCRSTVAQCVLTATYRQRRAHSQHREKLCLSPGCLPNISHSTASKTNCTSSASALEG